MNIENPSNSSTPTSQSTQAPTASVPEASTQSNQTEPEKKHREGLAITSLVLGFVSFIPLVGVLLGVLAIVLGAIGLTKIKKSGYGGKKMAIAGIILGILGILFSVVLYGSLFYFGFVAEDGPFGEPKKELSGQLLTQNAGYLELYKNKHGEYPKNLEDLAGDGYAVFPTDHYLKPFYYIVSDNGQTYELRSLGSDGEYGTADDIFPSK